MPQWLNILAIGSLALGFLCALIVLGDILTGHPQKMKIMNVVWPITPLYAGPLGLWAYYAIGRKSVKQPNVQDGDKHSMKAGSEPSSAGTADSGESGQAPRRGEKRVVASKRNGTRNAEQGAGSHPLLLDHQDFMHYGRRDGSRLPER